VAPVLNLAVLDALFCDPERPIAADELIDQFVPAPTRTPAQRALLGLGGALAALLVGVSLWRLSPVVRWLGLEGAEASGEWLRVHPGALAALFIAGALMFFPVTLLVGLTVLVHGWPLGALYAFAGSLAASAVSYAMGRLLPLPEVRGRWPAQMMWLRGQLRRRGLMALAVARLIPVGNFFAINMVAGSLRVPIGRFLAGTAMGLVPGILAMAIFTDRVSQALRSPAVPNVALVLVLVAAMAWALTWLGRRLARSTPPVGRRLAAEGAGR
jgi:uncharacterized membrane protein YdjX (TVP38/TMEM64 family)